MSYFFKKGINMGKVYKGSTWNESDDTFWPNVVRVVHLPGGISAVNGPPHNREIRFKTQTTDGKIPHLQITAYRDLSIALWQIGFKKVIGVDYFTDQNQIEGVFPPQWKSKITSGNNSLAFDVEQQRWSAIAFNAHKEKDPLLYDIARRINTQLMTLDLSLKKLSLSYQKQLSSLTFEEKKLQCGNLYSDLNTHEVFDCFQHFLFDACILRDYLSEAYSELILHKCEVLKKPITSFSGLISFLRKHNQSSESFIETLLNDSNPNGWLKKLTDYRNIITHVCPMSQLTKFAAVKSVEFKLDQNKSIMGVSVPIPLTPNPIKFSRHDAKNDFNKITEAEEEYIRQSTEESSSQDMLDYAYFVCTKLAAYTFEIAKRANCNEEKIAFNSKDLKDFSIKR
jgi:hypothetical protein